MAKAKKLPSGKWRVLLYVGKDDAGKRQYKSFTAETKKQAEADAALYSIQRKREQSAEITVGEAIDHYIRSKSNVLSPSTIAGYEMIRRNHIQRIMDIPLDDVTNAKIQAEFNREALRLSPKSLSNARGLLSAALSMHLPDFTLRVTLPAKQHIIRDLPTPGEVIRAVKGTEIELPCLLALWLSLRMSEVRGIRKEDISGNTLTIRSTRITINGEDVCRNQTKTYNSTRKEELPPYIMELIRNELEADDGEYLVKLSGQAIYKRFVRIIQKNGLKPCRFHDLRHLNASVMVELGVPDKYAMERGGWSTDSTLRNVYQHTFDSKRKEIDKRINDYFEKLL